MPPSRTELLRGLFTEHAGYVHASLRRLGVRASDLEDLTQDVFVAVHATLDGYDASRPAKPWLFAFCFRVASNHRRLARNRLPSTDDAAQLSGREPSPEEALGDAENKSMLEAALDLLSDDHRAAFVLHAIDGATGQEVADALGIPLNTAYSRIRLARRSVEATLRALSENGGAS